MAALIIVIGSGTMGRGIAEVALGRGLRVHLVDPEQAQRALAQRSIESGISRSLARGLLGEDAARGWAQRLTLGPDWRGLSPKWVIEAIPERMELKGPLFAQLDQDFSEAVWLASNTSSIAITAIQGMARRFPHRVGGLHFFNPVPRMALVEVIAGMATAPQFIEESQALVRQWGKVPVAVPDRPGFLVNRVARPYYLESLRMVDEGVVGMEACDKVFEGAGFPMGPFRLMDLVGIDVNFAVTQSVFEQTFYDSRYRPHDLQQNKIRLGHLGRKTKRGFYVYE
ncbi:MAG: 3-hydroxyacyl-CoA dehydrogenase family protein [Sulfobacillus sp.]